MRPPRDLDGAELARALGKLGVSASRARPGSHVRLTTTESGEHHVTVPAVHAAKGRHRWPASSTWSRGITGSRVSSCSPDFSARKYG